MKQPWNFPRTWVAAFAFAAAGAMPAHAQERLTIYSAYENSQMRPLIQAFEKANPDVKVDHFRQAGEELVATIELELRAKSPKADVVA